MLIKHSYDNRFVVMMERLKKQYGEEMFETSGIGERQLDINTFSKEFFKDGVNTADKSIDANANVNEKSVTGWMAESTKSIMKLNAYYQLWDSILKKHGIKRANKIIEAEITGAIRVNDLWLWQKPYCWAASLNSLVTDGMPFHKYPKTGEVKHFDSFINVSLQYLCHLSNSIAGAVAFPDFFIYCEYFIRKDHGQLWYENENEIKKIKQLFQNWIYSINFSWRSNQSPFTNLSVMDKYWLKSLFENHYNPDFSTTDFDNTMRVQKLFVECVLENRKNNPFTFPILTACLLYDSENEKFADDEFLDWVSEVNAEHGIFNIFSDDSVNALSSCCRLRSSLVENNIKEDYTNSFGVGGLSIGSHRVVALNLPQIAYASETWDEFKHLLEYRINICQDILDTHRQTLIDLINRKFLPLYNFGFMNLNKQYSTVGFMGMYEALEIMGFDILTDSGSEKGMEIIKLINEMNDKRTKNDGFMRNVEQIPGESASVAFAKKDNILFDGKQKYKLYSNQYIPLTRECDVHDRIKMQGKYDSKVGGGSILHVNVSSVMSKDQMKELMLYTTKNGVKYWAVNYGLSQCSTCGKTYVGKLDKSPCHDSDTKKFLRIVGFETAVSSWSKERREEYSERQFYSI